MFSEPAVESLFIERIKKGDRLAFAEAGEIHDV
jgi:hypothetical protein